MSVDSRQISDEDIEKALSQELQVAGETKYTESEDKTDSESDDTVTFIGADDYKDPSTIIWFTLAGKAFPTKMVNPFLMMKLAKAQNDDDLMEAMAYTYDMLMAMVPKRYHKEFIDHLTVSEYSEDDLNKSVEYVMEAWANNNDGHKVAPLAKPKDMPGPSTSAQEPATLKVVSFDKKEVTSRPLNEEEENLLKRLNQKEVVNPQS